MPENANAASIAMWPPLESLISAVLREQAGADEIGPRALLFLPQDSEAGRQAQVEAAVEAIG